MTKPSTFWAKTLLAMGVLFVSGSLLSGGGCKKRSPRPTRGTHVTARSHSKADFLVESLGSSLNHLPREVVLDLQPPTPILDDSKSADGQPVLAMCDVTPAVPDGPFNYLFIPKGNANFRKLGVRRGDIVRYFVLINEESAEHGMEEISYIERPVRRLDQDNPENALILEGDLGGQVSYPMRIEIWRFSDKRMNEIRRQINRYYKNPKMLIGWEPSSDESALVQILERANQWLRTTKDEDDSWQHDPLVGKLPTKLLETEPLAELLTDAALHSGPFDPTEARQLQQAIWMRDISRWAKGEAVSPVEVATALFDWTIRNIQLDPPSTKGYVHQPWQALMYGHGSAQLRAWVFAELCRQQQIDVLILASGDKWWLPAVLHDGQLHLYDSRLGLPLPGKEPGSVATLAEIAAEPSLLSQLELDDENKYSPTVENLQQASAWLIASPLQLAQRAQLLEQALEGDDYVVLSADTRRLVAMAKEHPHVDRVRLWPFSFASVLSEQTMSPKLRRLAAQRFLVFAQRPRLWKARVLHFQGTKEIPIDERNDPLAEPDLGHQQATALYQNPRVRPPNSQLARLEPSKRQIYMTSKGDASYWLGLLSFDLDKYKVAEDWLAKRTLAATPNGPWTAGARYNLARTYEALGDLPAAIELLEAGDSPQRQGDLIRARRLRQQLETAAEPSNNR